MSADSSQLAPTLADAELVAVDGYRLAATRFEPAVPVDGAPLVVVNAATGVKRTFYRRFATYLAEGGLRVVTYDYRGIGGSRRGPLRGFEARMADWCRLDFTGVLRGIAAAEPEARIAVVGHSLGGQAIGLTPEARRICAVWAVGAQIGWFGHWPLGRQLFLIPFWYLFLPPLTRLLGYFPSSKVGLGEDLPAGVALEWARWCRNRRFWIEADGTPLESHFADFRGRLHALSFADDGIAPAAAVAALVARFPAGIEAVHRDVAPAEVGLRRIGHFGFFQEPCREPLWCEARDWLLAV